VGHVQNAEVVTYRHNQRSKGFAFVQMNSVEEAKRAVDELHDKDFLGRKLVVSGAKTSEHQPHE
jgi:RNA recognition motif-containing protein